jgi:outer membrane protein assembly factor BamB
MMKRLFDYCSRNGGAASLAVTVSIALATLTGCASSSRHFPAELPKFQPSASIGQVWTSAVGAKTTYPVQLAVQGQELAVGSSDGTLAVVSTVSGKDLWRLKLGAELAAGVGFNGNLLAVMTQSNELVVVQSNAQAGTVLWRSVLSARSFTAPLIAGGRVFVLAGDRSVHAFDAGNGRKLWTAQRPVEPLVLNQAGTLGVYRNTLLVGGSGRLLGMNPDTGQIQWEASVATTRATNDIERLVDLVGTPTRAGDTVCVRAYQASVACVDALKGLTLWSKPTQGSVGISGDAVHLASTESDGRVKAWNRQTGELVWTNDKLAHRGLSAPLVIGNSVVVGDFEGYVHVLNKADGVFTARFKTDGSPIVAAPVVSGTVVIVATQKGGLYAYSPQ